MAKKKKAPEAKAPLRGLQDTPTNTNSYIVHDPDHELAMIVTDGAVDKVLLDGEELGGGGGGTSTCQVTMTLIGNSTVFTPFIANGELLAYYFNSDTTVTVPLYNGEVYLWIEGANAVDQLSGAIEVVTAKEKYKVTGDCSFRSY